MLQPAPTPDRVSINRDWLARLRADCRAPVEPGDDPEGESEYQEHVTVTRAYLGKILKACAATTTGGPSR